MDEAGDAPSVSPPRPPEPPALRRNDPAPKLKSTPNAATARSGRHAPTANFSNRFRTSDLVCLARDPVSVLAATAGKAGMAEQSDLTVRLLGAWAKLPAHSSMPVGFSQKGCQLGVPRFTDMRDSLSLFEGPSLQDGSYPTTERCPTGNPKNLIFTHPALTTRADRRFGMARRATSASNSGQACIRCAHFCSAAPEPTRGELRDASR